VIRPTALVATLPSLDGGNPVAAAILSDEHLLRMSDVDIDLSAVVSTACTPMVAGVYGRNAVLMLERVGVLNTRVSTRPDCESGVGVLVESGVESIVLGTPIYGRARLIARDMILDGFQKAGIVVTGPRAVLLADGGFATTIPGPLGGATPYGYQLSNGARGKIVNLTARGMTTANVGQLAAGVLAHEARLAKFRRDVFEDNQVGVFVVGDQTQTRRSIFTNHTSDAWVVFGDSNLLAASEIDGTSVSGAFINGDRNNVRGGYLTNAPIGLWLHTGFANYFHGINWGEVPLRVCGVFCGIRPLTPAAATPFTTRCTGALSCDDGDACTTDLCDLVTGTCSHGVTVCDDASICTTDTCDPLLGCQFTVVTVCDDGDPCTTNTCDTVGCQFPVTVCDDANACTTDACDPLLGCQFTPVLDGTACGVFPQVCTAGVCS
jgi:hypothetical protein